jgi:hypothetical protein
MKKTRIACLLASFILLPSAHAASHDAHAGQGVLSVSSAPAAPAESALVDGVVK